MRQHNLKNVNSCRNTKITFYLETAGVQNSILNLIFFFGLCGSQTIVWNKESLERLYSILNLIVVHFFNPSVY